MKNQMNHLLIIFFLIMFMQPGYSQKRSYEIRGNYERSVKQTTLNSARLIRDFIPGYPVNWILDYSSVEIIAISNGKAIKAKGRNENLSEAQIDLLNSADPGSDIVIDVNYIEKNSVIGSYVNNTMHVRLTVIPEIEAYFTGGTEELTKYLKTQIINKIDDVTYESLKAAKVTFTINEAGEIVNTALSTSTGNSKIDILIILTIKNMPKWKPAVSINGIKVAQEFQFLIGNRGC